MFITANVSSNIAAFEYLSKMLSSKQHIGGKNMEANNYESSIVYLTKISPAAMTFHITARLIVVSVFTDFNLPIVFAFMLC